MIGERQALPGRSQILGWMLTASILVLFIAAAAIGAAAEKASGMVHAVVRITNPAADTRKSIWRSGKQRMRVELLSSSRKPLLVTIVNSPNTWEIDPAKKRGEHIIDARPPTIVTMSVFPGEKDLSQLEIGNELQFFKMHKASVRHITAPKPVDRYQLSIAGKHLELDTIPGADRPLRIACPQCGKVKEVQYTEFERVNYEEAVFTPAEDITFNKPTYTAGTLGKPLATSNGAVTATVTATDVVIAGGTMTMPCWVYQSHGLATLGKPEIVVAVLKRAEEQNEDYPLDPIALIGSLAGGKNTADLTFTSGSWAQVPGFLGDKFAGVLFINAEPIPKINLVPGTLAAVAITPQELAVCELAGAARTMGHLSRQATYFPCPYWSKRGRKTTFTDADVALMKNDPFTVGMPSFISNASAMLRLKICTLFLTPDTGTKLMDALKKCKGKRSPLRMQLQVDPRAASFLVWQAEKDPVRKLAVGRTGINDGSVSGQYLLIVPDQPEDRLDIRQDGFALFLTNASLDKLISSLGEQANPIQLAAGDAVQFSILWNITSNSKEAEK